MSSSPRNVRQSVPAPFLLRTEKDQYVVKRAGSDEFQIASIDDGAFIFQMSSVSEDSDGLVLLQTLGGFWQVPADPSLGVVLQDDSAVPMPFLKFPVGTGFALGTPNKEYWLSVSDEGKLVFSKLTSPGVSETFIVQKPPRHHGHNCCGPSLEFTPSKALWNAGGHRAIVEKGIDCLRNPLLPTSESYEFISRFDSDSVYPMELYAGLVEADETIELDDFELFTSHFYDPDTETTYRKGNFPTALERGGDFFGASLKMLQYPGGNVSFDIGRRTYQPTPLRVKVEDADRQGIIRASARMLGIALHYFTDLSQPMHASNIPNVYDKHGTILDWRHSHFEAYGDRAVKGLLNSVADPYPQLTFAELELHDINGVAGLYKDMAKVAKKAWVEYIKPIFDEKRFDEAWGNEVLDGLKHSMYLAPPRVARLLAYWIYLDLKRIWSEFRIGDSHIYGMNSGGQVGMFSLTGDGIHGAVMPGAPLAQDMAVGRDEAIWVLSKEKRAYGFVPYYLASGSNKWVRLQEPDSGTKICVARGGTAYVVNESGQIWALEKPDVNGHCKHEWLSHKFFAQDIDVDADGSLWAVSNKPRGGDGNFVPYYLPRGAKDWVQLKEPLAFTKLAAAPDRTVRAITANGIVWRINKPDATGKCDGVRLSDLPGFFSAGSGKLETIGVARDGSVWVISSHADLKLNYLASGADQWRSLRLAGKEFVPGGFAAM